MHVFMCEETEVCGGTCKLHTEGPTGESETFLLLFYQAAHNYLDLENIFFYFSKPLKKKKAAP